MMIKMVKSGIALIAILMLVAELQASEKLLINTGFTPPVSTYFDKVLQEAAKRVNMDIELVEVSAERSLRMVVEGKADAECCRISKVIKPTYPTLVDVPVSFYQMNWVAFVKDKNITISQWDDLKKYSAAAVTGYKLAVIKVKEFSPSPQILDTHESMFKMLSRNRVDTGITAKLVGLKVIKDLKLDDTISLLQPSIFKIPLTLQLHEKHEDKVTLFSKVFTEINQDGTADRLLEEVLAEL